MQDTNNVKLNIEWNMMVLILDKANIEIRGSDRCRDYGIWME